MARKTIRDKILTLKRRFPKRTKYGFLYLHKRDLKTHYTEVLVYTLIYAPERGHSLFIWEPHRGGRDWMPPRWARWVNKEGKDILDSIMTAINIKRGDHWDVQRVIGFSGGEYRPRMHIVQEGKDALYPTIPSAKLARNKTAKKGK